MFAYHVVASFREYGDKTFGMMVLRAGSKADVQAELLRAGWLVKSIKPASMDHVEEVRYEVLDAQLRQAVKDRAILTALKLKREEAERRERRERIKQENAERERNALARRDLAISRAAGDVLGLTLERELDGNVAVATFCSKAALFFNQARMSGREIFTSLSLDFATIEVTLKCPNAVRSMRTALGDMNRHLEIESLRHELGQRLQMERQKAEHQVNVISSRTHVFGGSGLGLILSAMAADDAVNADQRAARELIVQFKERELHAVRQAERYQMQQQLIEFRVKASLSMLLVACGKSETVELDMPEHLENFVLDGLNSYP